VEIWLADTVPASQISTGTRGRGLTLTPSRVRWRPWKVSLSPASSARSTMANSSSRRARLVMAMPKASKVCVRPPLARVMMRGACAKAARVPICSASTMGW